MGRSILGVIVGLVLGVAIVWLVQVLGLRLYPLPPGVDPTDPDAIAAAIPSLPLASFLFVMASWFLGTWTGASTAVRIAGGPARWPGYVVGAGILAGALSSLLTIPHPGWFSAASVVGIVLLTWLASRAGASAPATGAA